MKQRPAAIQAPITESELDEWEARAHGEEAGSREAMLRLIAEVRRLRRRAPRPRIAHIPGRCGGAPTIAGTRIGVADVVALARRCDWDMDRVRAKEFPDLSPAQLAAAVQYNRRHEDEIETILRRNRECMERLPSVPLGR